MISAKLHDAKAASLCLRFMLRWGEWENRNGYREVAVTYGVRCMRCGQIMLFSAWMCYANQPNRGAMPIHATNDGCVAELDSIPWLNTFERDIWYRTCDGPQRCARCHEHGLVSDYFTANGDAYVERICARCVR